MTDPAGNPVDYPNTWHRRAVARNLDRLVAELRELVTAVERESGSLDRVAAVPPAEGVELYSYIKIAGKVVHTITNTLPNLGLGRLIQDAAEADTARHVQAATRRLEGGPS